MDGSAFNHMDIGGTVKALLLLLAIALPLAIWKAIEIALWLFSFIHVSFHS